jgi:hypothetical protein
MDPNSVVVYLDQNKWIQLARVLTGKESNAEVAAVAEAALADRIQLPLSAVHYLETARISDIGRRQRLGKVMWELSKGRTLLSQRDLIIHEAEVVLSRYFPQIGTGNIKLVGNGAMYAFGMEYANHFSQDVEDLLDRALVTGEFTLGIGPLHLTDKTHKLIFRRHLAQFGGILAQNLSPDKWEDAIYALNMADMAEPFCSVLWKHHIGADISSRTVAEHLRTIVDGMPSRKVDVHLHRQVLRNKSYSPKENDLEDWAALGVAVAYCDIVVCEKHFRDLVLRDNFRTKAVMLSNLSELAAHLR